MDVCGDIKAFVRLATPQLLSNNNRVLLGVDDFVFMVPVYDVLCSCSAVLFMKLLFIFGEERGKRRMEVTQ